MALGREIKPWVIRGRTITPDDVQAVQQLVTAERGASRWALARALCQRWEWRATSGRWKTRSALAVLSTLERRGWIVLPRPCPASIHLKVPAPAPVQHSESTMRTLDGALQEYRPLRWELVGTVAQRREWRALLARHHYLGAPELVGANLKIFRVWPAG
jgi:hypothetical protein